MRVIAFRVSLLAAAVAGLGAWMGAVPLLWTAFSLVCVAAAAGLAAALGAKA